MKFISALVGTTAVMTTGNFAMNPDEMGYGHEGELDFKLRGKFEAEGTVELHKFAKKLMEKHGPMFDYTCAKACFLTPACRFDGREQWSYCKYDHFPSTCFGLYHVPKHHGHGHRHGQAHMDMEMGGPEMESEWGWGKGHKFGKLCYQPTQPGCPERFPLICHRPLHRKHIEEDMFPDLLE